MKKLSIQFLLPFGGITGGIRAVIEIGNRLADGGHEVSVVMPRLSICSRRNRILRNIPGARSLMRTNTNDLGWAKARMKVVEVEDLHPKYLPKSDVLIATAWQTAECLMRFPRSHGVPIYFLQHYEVWSGPSNLVDRTWRAGFAPVVTAPWLADLARDKFGIFETAHVPYGVDPELFHPDIGGRALHKGGFRVGLLGHNAKWKGTADGLQAIDRLRKKGVDARPVLFGTRAPQKDWPDPGFALEYHQNPKQERLRLIYSSLDAFLCPSHTETGPLTVLEAMACQIPVVTTDVGNVGLWTEQGRLALISKPGQIETMARHLERYSREPGMASALAEQGRERALRFTWEATARKMEDAIRAALAKANAVLL